MLSLEILLTVAFNTALKYLRHESIMNIIG